MQGRGFMSAHTCAHVHLYTHGQLCARVCVYRCMFVCMCMYWCRCAQKCYVCVSMCLCVWLCVHVCVYGHMWGQQQKQQVPWDLARKSCRGVVSAVHVGSPPGALLVNETDGWNAHKLKQACQRRERGLHVWSLCIEVWDSGQNSLFPFIPRNLDQRSFVFGVMVDLGVLPLNFEVTNLTFCLLFSWLSCGINAVKGLSMKYSCFLRFHFYLSFFRKRGREGGKHRWVRGTSIACPSTRMPGMCPDRGSNRWPFAFPNNVQPAKPHWSGLDTAFNGYFMWHYKCQHTR